LEVVIVMHDKLQIQNTNIQKRPDLANGVSGHIAQFFIHFISANFSFVSHFQTGSQGNMISMAG
jgi:hypothetical protein